MLDNPLAIPASECDVVWDQIVDVVDDSFDVDSEQRVRRVGDVLTVGRIDTVPRTGSSILEFWKRDAADWYERWHGTLQTLRRRAVVQVIPTGETFQVEVVVFKELEDLPTAFQSTAGAATFRHDSSNLRVEEPVGVQPLTAGWIPLGRDTALEQRMLQKIAARLLPTDGRMVPTSWGMPHFDWKSSALGTEGGVPVDGTHLKPPLEVIPPPATKQSPAGPIIPGERSL